ncbi:ATPase, T2SS/T4P/T4SS family [Ruegeria sp.]|uniref:ATPase, T2SS/T4P/T4SS family n=1 Tax=Ruegeria sp. TaxID=1879320 RepID=UPI003B006390
MRTGLYFHIRALRLRWRPDRTDPGPASFAQLADHAARLCARLRRRAHPAVNVNGILEIGGERFRRAAALQEDGTLHMIREMSASVSGELRALNRRWHLPRITDRVAATPVSLERLYDRRGVSARAEPRDTMEPGARRLVDVLGEAAALGASDLKLFVRRTHADLRLKLGAEEITHGAPWSVGDAMEAIGYLYNNRARGDGAAAQLDATAQAFAVTEDSPVPLPAGVAALRGQKNAHGEGRDCIIMRLLYTRSDHEAGKLEDLGLDADVLEELARERCSDSGLVIIGGSTGDGKSTTLVRQLERLYRERDGKVSIYTIEDPIEYPIHGAGIAQFSVSPAAEGADRDAAWTAALLPFLRSNPDVGMISEIRSVNDARAILQFVISGHKIFTTIHSSSASSVLFRLISLGVDPNELAEPGVVSLVMRQTLVPVLCPDCARPASPPESTYIAGALGLEGKAARACTPMMRNRQGCATCLAGRLEGSADTVATARDALGGIRRKRAVAEYIQVDDTYRRYVAANDRIGAMSYWLAPKSDGGLGGRRVQDRVADLVAAGQVDYMDATNDKGVLGRAPLLLPGQDVA